MSATTIHSTDNTTKARFLAPGTHQRPDAKGAAGKGQGKGQARERATALEAEQVNRDDLVLISLSRLIQSAFNVRKSGRHCGGARPSTQRATRR